jgi:hypothetical protein
LRLQMNEVNNLNKRIQKGLLEWTPKYTTSL